MEVIKKDKRSPEDKEREIDKNIEAITSLMQHWGWKQFSEVVQYMQAGLQMEIFSEAFLKLDPVAKDKRHASIVETLRQLTRILELPEWLSRKKPSRWAEVTSHMIKEK